METQQEKNVKYLFYGLGGATLLYMMSKVVGMKDRNLLVNGGFERGYLTGWITQWLDPQVSIYCHPDAAHAGNFGLYVRAAAQGSYNIIQQYIKLLPGKHVNLSAYIYLPTDIPEVISISIHFYNDNGDLIQMSGKTFYFSEIEKSRWVQLENKVEVPADTYDVDVIIESLVGGIYYLDDIQLRYL